MKATLLDRINVDTIDYGMATQRVIGWTADETGKTVMCANVHMLMEACDSTSFADVVNSADMVTPDGMPLVWMLRLKGQRAQERVYGPTLMLHVLEAASHEGIPAGFYGGRPDVLSALVDRMQTRFPALKVTYAFSPPFRALTPEEDAQIVEQINNSGAKIIFVGLGCPKQEIWMASHRDRINAVMIGVGAAFDFHAGAKSQAPVWMQKSGLEWLFRMFTEPRRLWRRYLLHNPRFIFLAVLDLFGLLR